MYSRLACGLGLVLSLVSAQSARAQSAINKPWGYTNLDTLVSVRTPYRAQEVSDATMPWLMAFFTKGSYHHFMMVRIDVRGMVQQQVNTANKKGNSTLADNDAVVLDADKCLQGLLKLPWLALAKPKLSQEYVVNTPLAPDGQASHRVYSGVDPDSREAARMEVRWFNLQDVVYFFFCTTVDVDGDESRQERLRYFSTIEPSHL